MKLGAARVFVRDLAVAEAFYARVLGLPLRAGGWAHGYCVFDAGQVDLVVEAVPEDAPPKDQALVGRFTGLSFTVDDIEARHRELSASGVHFTGAPAAQPWGGTLATLRDPAGNELQLVQMPAVPEV
jgi:predicted enzyme related to lactoylglutathione lyase